MVNQLTQKFQFSRCAQQTIASVDAQFLANAFQHSIYFRLEICRIVDDVKVRMPNPGSGRFVIQVSGQINSFRPASVILLAAKEESNYRTDK